MSSNGGRAWQAMFELLRSQKAFMASEFAEFDLTVQLAFALHTIARAEITMRALAVELSCDASNATGLVDRLEARGLIERRTSDRDRRVKRLVVTPAGRRLNEKIEACLQRPPPAIAALSAADQRSLREILDRALANADADRLAAG